MFFRTPKIQIENVEKVEIDLHSHPLWERAVYEYLRSGHQEFPPSFATSLDPAQIAREHDKEDSRFFRALDYISKGISILSGVAVIVFVALLFFGQTIIGSIQVTSLLTVLSFTLVGGLISVGGVKMFSIDASLRKAKEKMERVVITIGGCPFQFIYAGQPTELDRPGNPEFCQRCPLSRGPDQNLKVDGYLKHNCKVYLALYRKWVELRDARKVVTQLRE